MFTSGGRICGGEAGYARTEKFFRFFFEKGVDKRGKMWYNNITVSESKAVDELSKGFEKT